MGRIRSFDAPWYTEETVETNLHMLRDFLIPLLLGKEIAHPIRLDGLFMPIRGNNMAKLRLNVPLGTLCQKERNLLAEALGGQRRTD